MTDIHKAKVFKTTVEQLNRDLELYDTVVLTGVVTKIENNKFIGNKTTVSIFGVEVKDTKFSGSTSGSDFNFDIII